MKPTRFSRTLFGSALSLAFSLPLFTQSAQAASASWNVDAAGAWATDSNWNPAAAPGATTGTASTDIATFGINLTAARIVTVDANRNIGGISFTNTSAFGYTLSSGNLILSAGGVIQTSGAAGGNHTDTISSAIRLAGDGTFTGGSTNNNRLISIGAVTGSATASNTSTLTLNGVNTGNNNITGVIGNGSAGGNLAVSKSGTGTWALSGTNTYTGGTSVSAGTLISNAVGSLGGNGATVTVSGGTLSLRGNLNNDSSVQTLNYNKAITVTGDSTLRVERTSQGGQKTIQINSLAVTGSSRTVNITNANGFALQVTGASTINGNTTFNNTMNSITAGGAFASNTVGFTLNTLTLADTAAVGTTTSTFAVVAVTPLNNVGPSGNGSGSFNFVQTGGTNITGAISNNASDPTKILAITKTGTGTLTLSGASTYTGATTVSAGTLAVTGSIVSATTVNGGTLAGTGTVGAVTVESGARIAPGITRTPATLTTGTATFNNGSIFSWDVNANGSAYDKITNSGLVDGGAAGGSIFQIVVADATFSAANGWNTTKTWTDVFSSTGTGLSTLFTSFQVVDSSFNTVTVPNGGGFSFSGNTLTYSPVPEPSTALAGLLLGAGLLRRRRVA